MRRPTLLATSILFASLLFSLPATLADAKPKGRFVEVASLKDSSQILSFWSRLALRVTLEKSVADSGLARRTKRQGFYISPVVSKLTTTKMGNYTLVDCRVSLYLSPVSYTHLTLPTNREV